ncbi:uncharacterized protein BDR25DRAFT_353955 [Lindgomyces ingoldianus]|uniref:Uncharacterized protein n=1 Tax=Lindgomyces ingoldianus TaxID=673940 RepID=A0ACB6R0D1_9PLEO|nr:uncharacterized protein BDR25DRAFT_353955 [Lindgomyces ingoldianus]KAF2472255.1 hypothetical protein BDR25DRAFT_353955 [Lindgomyces ingoldianus]
MTSFLDQHFTNIKTLLPLPIRAAHLVYGSHLLVIIAISVTLSLAHPSRTPSTLTSHPSPSLLAFGRIINVGWVVMHVVALWART